MPPPIGDENSRRLLSLFFLLVLMPLVVPNSNPFGANVLRRNPLIKRARTIHEKVIVLDSHIDFEPADLNSERNYTQRVVTQFNLPQHGRWWARCALLRHLDQPQGRNAESRRAQTRWLRARLQTGH